MNSPVPKALARFASRIIATHIIPSREAAFCDLPKDLHPDLTEALKRQGFERLFAHQKEMYDRARAGENVVITTGTASGKTLAFLLPIIDRVLRDPSSRALLLYPTKALGQDQLRGIVELVEIFGDRRIEAGIYDGDTPPDERTRVRERCHLVLTNPDMLNAAWLPNHGKKGFTHVFRNLRWLVVDEMHVYRGAFGSHFSNLMRRLGRITRYYGSNPAYLASSATIANARELAETLFDRKFALVDRDGSPSAGKTIHFWQPPLLENDFRRGVVQEMATILPELVVERQKTIAFCRSRKETEVVLKETRDALRRVAGNHDESDLVAGYRGGYTPVERREVEKSLLTGRLVGVVSTNALELGIDIGALEVVVQAGFPGTRASFWQQIGRAGRRGRHAHAIIILRSSPIDQWIGKNPEWLVNSRSEHAVLDPANLVIQLAHVRAAAAELPLLIDDSAIFPDLGEIIAVLEKSGEVKLVYGAYHWAGNPHPAGDFSLRNLDGDRFKVVNQSNGKTLTEMDRPQTYHEGHVRAVYLHDGQQYLVDKLDLVNHQVLVRPVEQNYYTEPDVRAKIDVLREIEKKPFGRVTAQFGDVRVDETTIGYKMLEFHNHQNLGYEILPEPLVLSRETEAIWIAVPDDVLEILGQAGTDYVAGMVHGISSCARMATMAESSDLGATSFHAPDEEKSTAVNAVILYDFHPGGLGFAQKAYELLPEIIANAVRLVDECACKRGCPACVGDHGLEKTVVAWAMKSLSERLTPPKGWEPQKTHFPPIEWPRMPWDAVEKDWSTLRTRLAMDRRPGAAFLATIEKVLVRRERLTATVSGPRIADWLADEANRSRLSKLIESLVATPKEWTLEFEFEAVAAEASLRKSDKVRRRFDDLRG